MISTVKEMYDNNFISDLRKYQLDEKIKQATDPLKTNIKILQETTGTLEAQTDWINKYNIMNLKKLKRDTFINRIKSSSNYKRD